MTTRKLIVSFDKMAPPVKEAFYHSYPEGVDGHTFTVENHKREVFPAVEVKADGAIYLVRVGPKRKVGALTDDDFLLQAEKNAYQGEDAEFH